MAISIRHMAITVAFFGLKAFSLGIIAERKKPESGNPVTNPEGFITCKYPQDPSFILGFASMVSLTISVIIGMFSIFYPYKGKSVPVRALFQSKTMIVYFQIAVLVSIFAEVMLLWPTITELGNLLKTTHHNLNTTCPTAKTGLFGGGAFMALNASLFWLVCLMLSRNAREDYLDDEEEETRKGAYGQVLATDYLSKEQAVL